MESEVIDTDSLYNNEEGGAEDSISQDAHFCCILLFYFRLQELYDQNDIQNDAEEKEINSNKATTNQKGYIQSIQNSLLKMCSVLLIYFCVFIVDSENKSKVATNGHGEADQNSNVVQKIEEVEEKELQLRLEVSSSTVLFFTILPLFVL